MSWMEDIEVQIVNEKSLVLILKFSRVEMSPFEIHLCLVFFFITYINRIYADNNDWKDG